MEGGREQGWAKPLPDLGLELATRCASLDQTRAFGPS